MPRSSVLGEAVRVSPSEADQISARKLVRLTKRDRSAFDLQIAGSNGITIELSDALIQVLLAAAEELAAGRAIMILAADVHLTPAEVAELLGYSRPFVARLLDADEIPSEHLPGSKHRVVKLNDVLAFQAKRERRREGRRRIAEVIESEACHRSRATTCRPVL